MNKIVKFLSLTFFITWILWGILIFLSNNEVLNYGDFFFMILFVIGGNGPFIAALLVMKRSTKDLKDFKKRLFNYKVNILWYLWVLLAPFILFSAPWIYNTLTGGIKYPLFMTNVISIIPLAIINILLGGLEEVGWRGVLLPELLKKFNIIYATVMTSIIWTLWHLPLWFVKGTSQQGMNFFGFLILGLGFSFLLTVLYTKTKSILLTVLLHSLINSYPSVVSLRVNSLIEYSLVVLVISIIIYILTSITLKYKELRNYKV